MRNSAGEAVGSTSASLANPTLNTRFMGFMARRFGSVFTLR